MKRNYIARQFSNLFLAGCCLSVFSCEIQENFEYTKSKSNSIEGMTAWEYIQSHDSLEVLEEAIRITELESFYQQDIMRTFIAPTNGAFKKYLAENNYQNVQEIPTPILRNTLKYSIVNESVSFNDPDLMEANNPLAYETENGQVMYLSHDSNFRGIINESTSKQWIITTSNLEVANGVVQVVSAVVYFSAPSIDTSVPDLVAVMDTIYPLHDSYINGGILSGDNYGTDALLKIKNVTGDGLYDRKAYLMFDLTDFDKEGVITELTLELAVKFTHAKGLDVNVHSVPDNSWNEMGLTWDNAPAADPDPIATLVTTKISTFRWDITNYYLGIEEAGKVSFMVDGESGGDETDEFASKENTSFPKPMLIAKMASGNSSLVLEANTGFNVARGDVVTLTNSELEISGAPVEDIIYTIEQAPENGWLIKGANILNAGDDFTQKDIDVKNIIYINNGDGNSDKIVVSVKDKAGSAIDAFDVNITVQ